MPKVAVFGYLSIDRIVTSGFVAENVPGGAALYAALGARRAGADVAILACRGEDWPDAWLTAMAEAGLDVTSLVAGPGATRRASLTHADDGSRLSRHFAEARWWERTEALLPPVGVPRADFVVLCPMPLAHASTIRDASGIPMLADTSAAFVSRDPAGWREFARRLAVFAPSREETVLLFPGCEDEEAVMLLASGGCAVVQKRGAAGVAWCEAEGATIEIVPAPATNVVDPTGAGDATVGALAARLAAGDDLGAACRAAVRIGAAAVSGIGPAALGLDVRP